MHKKILLLGSGELGKELVITLKRLGQTVIAVDSYVGAPAMQVADGFEVCLLVFGFNDPQRLVGGDARQALLLSVGPADLEVGGFGSVQAKMQT